jgi:hypothetical protein
MATGIDRRKNRTRRLWRAARAKARVRSRRSLTAMPRLPRVVVTDRISPLALSNGQIAAGPPPPVHITDRLVKNPL